MDEISAGADNYLRLLDSEFWCELANHSIGSESVKYPTATDARLAMLRLAYLRGKQDAQPKTSFEQDVAAVALRTHRA